MPFSVPQAGGINNAANARAAAPKSNNMSFTMDTFLQLLAAQMQNQDILNPTSNNEYMGQMVLMSVMQAVDNLSYMSLTSYASSMVGKNVTVAEVKNGKVEEVTGVVTGVSIYGGEPVIHVNGKDYSLSQIMVVGEKPAKPENPEKPEDQIQKPDGGIEGPDGESVENSQNEQIQKPDGGIEGPDGEAGQQKPEAEGSEDEKPKA